MARKNKIRTAGKEARVRELRAKGLSYQAISDALAAEGLKVSAVAVGRLLNEEAEDRAEAYRQYTTQDVAETAPLITGSLKKLVIIGVQRAELLSGLADSSGDLARIMTATTGALRALHTVTVGTETPAADLAEELAALLKKK